MTDPSPKLGKIFIGGLSYETTDEKLRTYFGAYGAVTDAVVMKDPISRRSRGFGFITYADPTCVDRALAQPNHVLDSRRVEAKRAVPRAESTREPNSLAPRTTVSPGSQNPVNASAIGATKKIFVGGLHYETKDADFKKYFEQFGKVVSAEVMFNRETNKSRGFGFVIFETEDSVEQVLQNRNHIIDSKSVEVKRAVPRTDAPPARAATTPPTTSGTGSPPDSRSGSFTGVGMLPPGSIPTTRAVAGAMTIPVPTQSVSTYSQPPVHEDTSVPTSNDGKNNSGTLGGYAAAVRYGGRGVPPGSNISAGPNGTEAGLAESMERVTLDQRQGYEHDLSLRDQSDMNSSHRDQNLLDASRHDSVLSGAQTHQSPYLQNQHGSFLNGPPNDHTQWGSEYALPPRLTNDNQQSGMHGLPWGQPPPANHQQQQQWQQWSSREDLLSNQDSQIPPLPRSDDNSQGTQPPVPSTTHHQSGQQSSFFSMFSSTPTDSPSGTTSSVTTSTYGRSNTTWDNGYGSGGLGSMGMGGMGGIGISGMGMGGMGMGMGMGTMGMGTMGSMSMSSMGLNMDSSDIDANSGSNDASFNRNGGYGSSIGGGLGSFQADYSRSGNELSSSIGGFNTFGGNMMGNISNGSNSGGNVPISLNESNAGSLAGNSSTVGENSNSSAGEGGSNGSGLDYGSYRHPTASSEQYPPSGYR